MVSWQNIQDKLVKRYTLDNVIISSSVLNTLKFPKAHAFISKREGNFAICGHS